MGERLTKEREAEIRARLEIGRLPVLGTALDVVAELLAELDALRAGPDAAELETLRARVRMLEAERAEAVRLGLIPNHPLTFGPGDNNVGRACLCGVSIPAGCRHVHAAWCRGSARARVRELEADQAQAAQAVVDAQACEMAFKERAEKAEARVRELEAERDALRRRIETTPPWGDAPLSKEEMDALRKRWSFAPEQYQADADALIATVRQRESDLAETRAQLARLREAAERFESDLSRFCDGPARDALRAALSTTGPTLAEIEAAARAPVEAQLARLREAAAAAVPHLTGAERAALYAALSDPGPTMAEIERAAIVRELRALVEEIEAWGNDRYHKLVAWLRQRAADMEAGRG